MQNIHQTNLGHSNKMIISHMLIQQMLTGLGILQAARLSSDMFEHSADITWLHAK
jgi:hypothetical protein